MASTNNQLPYAPPAAQAIAQQTQVRMELIEGRMKLPINPQMKYAAPGPIYMHPVTGMPHQGPNGYGSPRGAPMVQTLSQQGHVQPVMPMHQGPAHVPGAPAPTNVAPLNQQDQNGAFIGQQTYAVAQSQAVAHNQAQHQTNVPLMQALIFDTFRSAYSNESQYDPNSNTELYVFVDSTPRHFLDFVKTHPEAINRIKRMDLRIMCEHLDIYSRDRHHHVLNGWLDLLRWWDASRSVGLDNSLYSIHIFWDHPMISNNPYLIYALGRLDVRGMVVITGNWTSKIAGHLARNLKKGWGSRRLPRTILPQSSLSMNSNLANLWPRGWNKIARHLGVEGMHNAAMRSLSSNPTITIPQIRDSAFDREGQERKEDDVDGEAAYTANGLDEE